MSIYIDNEKENFVRTLSFEYFIQKFNYVPYLESFIKKFNDDWTNPQNEFSIPHLRAIICGQTISDLIRDNFSNLALDIFNMCKNKKAWNPCIGIKNTPNVFSSKIREICYDSFKETQKLIKEAQKRSSETHQNLNLSSYINQEADLYRIHSSRRFDNPDNYNFLN